MTHKNRAEVIKATLLGLIAVFVWGPTLPIMRLISDQIGGLGYICIASVVGGCCGVLISIHNKTKILTPEAFKSPWLWLRWACFVIYICLCTIAINLVSRPNVPLVILLNYLWPTMVIIWSVVMGAVRITHRWAFILGSLIVISSLGFELVGPEIFQTHHIFPPSDQLAFFIMGIGTVLAGLQSAVVRKYGHVTGGGAAISYFQLTFALGLPFYFASPAMMPWDLSPILLILFFGIAIVNFLGHLSWSYGVQHGNVVVLSLCADFIPWIALISAHLFLHAEITTMTMIAAFTLVIGAMITRYGTL